MHNMLFVLPFFWPVTFANVQYDFRFFTDLLFGTSICKNNLEKYAFSVILFIESIDFR